jgi:CheY-like chemotaxis protein
MSKRGPIIIAEDDIDEREILLQAFNSIGVRNEIKFFDHGQLVLDYLNNTPDKPFIILCDINLPVMNGIELREAINQNEYLRRKSIPFIFLTTYSSPESVNKAYEMAVQGFFVKENTIQAIVQSLRCILEYWTKCKHPNNS